MRDGLAPLVARAPAKINLSLHVLGRRLDGYHDLESLVAFAGTGDSLRLEPGPRLSMEVTGPTASLSGEPADNLVLKAARLLQERVQGLRVGAFRLTKRLPVAAGIGGGSSDAAAALRLLGRLNGLRASDPRVVDAARATGADVPVCLDARARMMSGRGETLGPALRLPRLFAVLVNPGVPVSTPAVFATLGLDKGQTLAGAPHPPIAARMAAGDIVDALRLARNDMEPAARSIEPLVGEALALIAQTEECRLSRMSGSGGTVFGLYPSCDAAAAAAKSLARARPGWWIKATVLR